MFGIIDQEIIEEGKVKHKMATSDDKQANQKTNLSKDGFRH